jgi:hypothetical protein
MGKIRFILAGLAIFYSLSVINAQDQKPKAEKGHPKTFVDKNGDGYNDNAPDHDNDGIPNCVDTDYKGAKMQNKKFIDLNGDGINDNTGKGASGKKGNGKYGSGNKIGSINSTGSPQNANGRGYKGGKK